MQLPKVVLSWLSALTMILGVVIESVHAFFDSCVATATVSCPATDPVIARILILAGAVLAVARGLMKDFGGSSDPVVAAAASAGAVAGADVARKAGL